MKMALMVDGPDLSALVSDFFADSQWLLIVDEEDGRLIEAVARGEGGDVRLAGLVVASGSEGVLCGPIEKEPFLIIADEGGVSRYLAAGLSGEEALKRFRRRDLDFIRDYIGGPGHRHSGGAGECSGSRHQA